MRRPWPAGVAVPEEVVRAAGTFMDTGAVRLTDPVLLRHGIWAGADLARQRGLPIQFHTGWGDPDLVLHLTNPTLLTGLIRQLAALDVSSLTPLAALNLLAEWQQRLRGQP